MTTTPECICTKGETVNGREIPLWECPCAECTRLEWEITRDNDDTGLTLQQWRGTEWPDEWPKEASTVRALGGQLKYPLY